MVHLVCAIPNASINDECVDQADEGARIGSRAGLEGFLETLQHLHDIAVGWVCHSVQKLRDILIESRVVRRDVDRQLHEFVEIRCASGRVVLNPELLLIALDQKPFDNPAVDGQNKDEPGLT